MDLRICLNVYLSLYTRTFVSTCKHAHTHTNLYLFGTNPHTHTHARTHARTHTHTHTHTQYTVYSGRPDSGVHRREHFEGLIEKVDAEHERVGPDLRPHRVVEQRIRVARVQPHHKHVVVFQPRDAI